MTPAEIQRRVREKRKKNGLCIKCAGQSRPNKSHCQKCADDGVKYNKERRANNKEQFNLKARLRYQSKKNDDLCPYCGNKILENQPCSNCKTRRNSYSSNYKHNNIISKLCPDCGNDRGVNTIRCDGCAERDKSYYNEYGRQNREKRWNQVLLSNVMQRALRKSILFNITIDDIPNPAGKRCPVFGWEFEFGINKKSDRSATIDRINAELGYVKGNIQLISSLANSVKSDALPDTILKVGRSVLEREINCDILEDHSTLTKQIRQKMVSQKRARNKKVRNLEFSMEWFHFSLPESCPCTGVKFNSNDWKTCPSIDRINNLRGYVPGNIWVISAQANAIKSSATGDQIMMVYDHITRNG